MRDDANEKLLLKKLKNEKCQEKKKKYILKGHLNFTYKAHTKSLTVLIREKKIAVILLMRPRE